MAGSNNSQQPPADGGQQSLQPPDGTAGSNNRGSNNRGSNNSRQPPDGKAAVFRYRCVTECTFQGAYRRIGDIVELPEEKDVPYFELVKA